VVSLDFQLEVGENFCRLEKFAIFVVDYQHKHYHEKINHKFARSIGIGNSLRATGV
jgi:hypothetical protein